MTMAHPTRRRGGARLLATVRLAGLRICFRTLDLLAPQVGANLAMRIWCTLPPGRRRKDHRPEPGEVRRLGVPRGGTVAVESWGQGPVVYLMHGWGGWRGQLGAFVTPLVAAGCQVVAVDAPGHGDSDPSVLGPGKSTAVEFIEALEVAGKEYGPAAGVVAHSLGCTVATMVIREGLSVQRVVLIAPNHDFLDITYDFARLLGFTERTRKRLQAVMEDFVRRPITDFHLAPIGSDGAFPDTLVIHDRRDKETPYDFGRRLAGSWPNARLASTDGLGHQRILADPQVAEMVVAHIRG